MFLTRSQRIGTVFLLTFWYGTIFISLVLVLLGAPGAVLLLFWTALLAYLGVVAILPYRPPGRPG